MAASALSRRFASAREQWGVLAQTGAWLLAVICTFVLPPPAGGEGAGKGTTEAFTAFFVAVLVGLMYVPVTRWRGHRYLRRWLAVTVASLATGTAAYVVYDHLRAEWTVPYDETRVTRGKTYTALAQQHRAADPSVSDADLVEFAGGISQDVWIGSEIASRHLRLRASYLFTNVALAICLIAVTQLLAASRARPASVPEPAPAKRRSRSRKKPPARGLPSDPGSPGRSQSGGAEGDASLSRTGHPEPA